MDGEKMASEISYFINSISFTPGPFIKAMANDHRTLQQSFTRLCLAWLYHLAETESFDLRNQASVETAKKIKDALGPCGNHLPYI